MKNNTKTRKTKQNDAIFWVAMYINQQKTQHFNSQHLKIHNQLLATQEKQKVGLKKSINLVATQKKIEKNERKEEI